MLKRRGNPGVVLPFCQLLTVSPPMVMLGSKNGVRQEAENSSAKSTARQNEPKPEEVPPEDDLPF